MISSDRRKTLGDSVSASSSVLVIVCDTLRSETEREKSEVEWRLDKYFTSFCNCEIPKADSGQ